MDIDKELKNHIIYEFFAGAPNRENILFESRGVVNGLHKAVKAIVKDVLPQVNDTCKYKTEIYQPYSGKLSDKGLTSFFDDYELEITTRYGSDKRDYRGGFSPKKSLVDTENGVTCSPVIDFSLTGNNPKEMMATIEFAIGHELTHAYNLVMYANKNGLGVDDVIRNYLYGQHYYDIKTSKINGIGNESAIADVLYKLNRMERNAYIAQLKQELETKSNKIKDSKSAWDAVLGSESYRKFKDLEDNMSVLFNPSLSLPTKKEVLKVTNKITGKEFQNYNQVKKFYSAYWNTWRKKYLSTAAKIAYDVFEKDNDTVDGFGPEDQIIES